jgi:hypothetical protein
LHLFIRVSCHAGSFGSVYFCSLKNSSSFNLKSYME